MRLTAIALFACCVPACTWVHMAPGAKAVRLIPSSAAPAGCEDRGEIVVNVKDRLGPYARNAVQVQEELETLARNEAPGLNADTLEPAAPPADGEQRFRAWRCAGAR